MNISEPQGEAPIRAPFLAEVTIGAFQLVVTANRSRMLGGPMLRLYTLLTIRLRLLPANIKCRTGLRSFSSWKRGIRPRGQAPHIIGRRIIQLYAWERNRTTPITSTSSRP